MEYDKENTIDYHLRTDLDVLVAKCILVSSGLTHLKTAGSH